MGKDMAINEEVDGLEVLHLYWVKGTLRSDWRVLQRLCLVKRFLVERLCFLETLSSWIRSLNRRGDVFEWHLRLDL